MSISVTIMELRAKDGHSIYKFNVDTREIVVIKKSSKKVKTGCKVYIEPEPRCLYCSALNERNAIKHFKNQVTYLLR